MTIDPMPDGISVTTGNATAEKAVVFTPVLTDPTDARTSAVTVTAVAPRPQGIRVAACLRARLPEDEEIYFESRAERVGDSATSVRFPLAEAMWKREDTGWRHTDRIPPEAQIEEMGFVIYGAKAGETIQLRRPALLPSESAPSD